MGYTRAEDILPAELIEAIQEYIDGGTLYIPRKTERRSAWGSQSGSRERLSGRNGRIFAEYCSGSGTKELAEKYFLSEKSIQRIVRNCVPSPGIQSGEDAQ